MLIDCFCAGPVVQALEPGQHAIQTDNSDNTAMCHQLTSHST